MHASLSKSCTWYTYPFTLFCLSYFLLIPFLFVSDAVLLSVSSSKSIFQSPSLRPSCFSFLFLSSVLSSLFVFSFLCSLVLLLALLCFLVPFSNCFPLAFSFSAFLFHSFVVRPLLSSEKKK